MSWTSSRKGVELFKVMEPEFARETHGQYSELAQLYDKLSLAGDPPAAPSQRAYPAYLFQQAMPLTEPSFEGSEPFSDWRAVRT
ncbi:hypothetical protein GCM10007094_00590 [Pseudovibrio japonicus]|uniref:Uncharacterized protein n=1 Tax=Pseudovibrio japonicus TaxID=366534 RepID=A0ABQ3DUR1_9HYPH|nr:hypothetical protein [Pseudovibrio japonicus]GHB17064.1 hypothetical protein GCM10007094_00590 [Pseudovibrio japonicus]